MCRKRLFGLLPRLLETFQGSGHAGLGRNFSRLFGNSDLKGPRDLCKARAGSQRKPGKSHFFATFSLLGGSAARVTFELLFRYFECFGVVWDLWPLATLVSLVEATGNTPPLKMG